MTDGAVVRTRKSGKLKPAKQLPFRCPRCGGRWRAKRDAEDCCGAMLCDRGADCTARSHYGDCKSMSYVAPPISGLTTNCNCQGGWICPACADVLRIHRSITNTSATLGHPATAAEQESDIDLLTVLKAAANYIIYPEAKRDQGPTETRETIIKGLMWAIGETGAATSGAREAAKEIAGLNKPNSYKREDWDAYQNAIVEIISEHFPDAVPVEEQKDPQAAIALLRSLRNTNDSVEVQRQIESWNQLQEDLKNSG